MKEWGYYEVFIRELNRLYIEQLNAKRATFRGSPKSPQVIQQITDRKHKEDESMAQRTDEIKKRNAPKPPEQGNAA